ncbi:MAG: glycosyltransferase family 2 protein [Myxococcota bacterium]
MASTAPPAGRIGRDPASAPSLLVALPALNEERTVAEVVRAVPREIPGIGAVEVVVVDDGSSDRTAEEARAAGAQVIRHPQPRGVGAAFHSALAHGIERGAEFIVSIDADGQFDPADIPALVRPVVAGEADFATASRFADPALVPDMPWIKLWGNRMMSRLISGLAGQTFHDVSCGMRCYSRDAALRLTLTASFTYTQEVVLNLAFKQMRIVEVPIRVRGERQHGESRVAGSLWRYGFRTARIAFRSFRDYKPMRFFGGLAGALMIPAAGLGVFLLYHYVTTGSFSPHKWAGFTALGLTLMALMMLQLGMTGAMLARHRVYLEEVLYRQRADQRTQRAAE